VLFSDSAHIFDLPGPLGPRGLKYLFSGPSLKVSRPLTRLSKIYTEHRKLDYSLFPTDVFGEKLKKCGECNKNINKVSQRQIYN